MVTPLTLYHFIFVQSNLIKDFNNENFIETYISNITQLTSVVDAKFLQVNKSRDKEEIQNFVNEYCRTLTDIIHEAVTLSQTSKVIHTRKRNHWWSGVIVVLLQETG